MTDQMEIMNNDFLNLKARLGNYEKIMQVGSSHAGSCRVLWLRVESLCRTTWNDVCCIFIFFFSGGEKQYVYFMAIIDVLTHYGVKKQAAKAAKTVKYGEKAEGISTVEPEQYAKRFMDFMSKAID
jgi:hypothetical protein